MKIIEMSTLWGALLLIGLITFFYRALFILFADALHLPGWVQQPLRFVPVAALTAIIVPELLVREGTLALTGQNERLVAGLFAIGIAWWSKNTLLTLTSGMVALYLLQWWGGS